MQAVLPARLCCGVKTLVSTAPVPSPVSLQEQLQRLYPRLKVLAFGAKPETVLHTYFPSFLSRATPSCPPGMKKEVSCEEGCTTGPLISACHSHLGREAWAGPAKLGMRQGW